MRVLIIIYSMWNPWFLYVGSKRVMHLLFHETYSVNFLNYENDDQMSIIYALCWCVSTILIGTILNRVTWFVKQYNICSAETLLRNLWIYLCCNKKNKNWKSENLSLRLCPKYVSKLFSIESLNLSKCHGKYKQKGWLAMLPLEWHVRVKWLVGTDGSGLEGALMNSRVFLTHGVILCWQSCGVCQMWFHVDWEVWMLKVHLIPYST